MAWLHILAISNTVSRTSSIFLCLHFVFCKMEILRSQIPGAVLGSSGCSCFCESWIFTLVQHCCLCSTAHTKLHCPLSKWTTVCHKVKPRKLLGTILIYTREWQLWVWDILLMCFPLLKFKEGKWSSMKWCMTTAASFGKHMGYDLWGFRS